MLTAFRSKSRLVACVPHSAALVRSGSPLPGALSLIHASTGKPSTLIHSNELLTVDGFDPDYFKDSFDGISQDSEFRDTLKPHDATRFAKAFRFALFEPANRRLYGPWHHIATDAFSGDSEHDNGICGALLPYFGQSSYGNVPLLAAFLASEGVEITLVRFRHGNRRQFHFGGWQSESAYQLFPSPETEACSGFTLHERAKYTQGFKTRDRIESSGFRHVLVCRDVAKFGADVLSTSLFGVATVAGVRFDALRFARLCYSFGPIAGTVRFYESGAVIEAPDGRAYYLRGLRRG